MNFKDIYKSANDNISGDRQLIETIFEKAENKKGFFATYYRQISVCAAAVILIMTVSILPMFTNVRNNESVVYEKVAKKESFNDKSVASESETFRNDEYVANNIKESAKDNTKSNEIPIHDTQKKNSSLAGKNPSVSMGTTQSNDLDFVSGIEKTPSEKTSSEKTPSEINGVNDDNNIDKTESRDVNEETTEIELQDVPAVASMPSVMMVQRDNEDITTSRPSAGSGGGGGGGGSVRGGNSSKSSGGMNYTETVSMTSEEYFDYLGISIPSAFSKDIGGLKVSVPDVIYTYEDSTGKTIDDAASFVFLDNNNPDRIILVSTTKLSEPRESISKDGSVSEVMIENHPVTLITDDYTVNSTFRVNDVWFNVNFRGISLEDVKLFISSCLK